ncbi:MAG: 1-(5-phosphoribosyl)-5-amino-4-imidazole-carboxylate carboxylase [Phycisphaerae bacterium SM1_79]|nr:MAG: 1-(5-phosphoribosyl)-5-amino-4-imidazole-carboxylate carboxylase [Phycisphaerae bacterium SM1_79]
MQAEQLKELLEQVKNGKLGIDEAIEKLRHLPFEDLGFACIDHHRQIRRGFPEVIYCPGKTTEQIIKIFESLAAKGNNVLATRAEPDVFEALAKTKKFPKARYEPSARAIMLEQKKPPASKTVLPIVTAGTADLPVASEAKVTAEIMGQRTELICDVGVAGLHRLFEHLPKLQKANVIIVVAGMEGALASVVGGLVSCPVIAVPTSVGYGSSFEGLSALLTMLNSCASGITVVNIDNGFSAAVTATLINRKIEAGSKDHKH